LSSPDFARLYHKVYDDPSIHECTGWPGVEQGGIWVRSDLVPGSPEVVLSRALAADPSADRVSRELASCRSAVAWSCEYVTRAVYRNLRSFESAGDLNLVINLFRAGPSGQYDAALLSSRRKGGWYKPAIDFFFQQSGAGATPTTKASTVLGPIALTAGRLTTLVASLGQPVYWVGVQSGSRYELTRVDNGSVFLRYLPAEALAGDKRPFRTVGTYPVANAFSVIETLTKEPGARKRSLSGGGLLYFSAQRPTNVYLAYPNLDYQIEVYDPTPGAALHLILTGQLRVVR
jgi:hypothetical protein